MLLQPKAQKGSAAMENLREKTYYRKNITELVEKIENQEILKLIYGLVKSGYEEEKAGSE